MILEELMFPGSGFGELNFSKLEWDCPCWEEVAL